LIRQLCRRLYDADALAGAGRDQLIALSVERLNGFVAGFDKRCQRRFFDVEAADAAI
jgi:hypothetical protein